MGMSTGGSRGDRRRAGSDINVTPLVDVMLVLLIIFMVTAPMLQQKVPVDLPRTDDTQVIEQSERQNVLVINAAGDIEFKGSTLPLDTLEHNRLIEGMEEIYLYADRTLKYELVVQVMTKLKNAGVKKLNMVTDEQEPGTAADKAAP